jgi:hypothetical protein
VVVTRRPSASTTSSTTTEGYGDKDGSTSTTTSGKEIDRNAEDDEVGGVGAGVVDERRRIDAYDVQRPGMSDVLDASTSSTTTSTFRPAAGAAAPFDRACPSIVDARGLVWPATPGGRTASVACPSYSVPGVARWRCVVDRDVGDEGQQQQQHRPSRPGVVVEDGDDEIVGADGAAVGEFAADGVLRWEDGHPDVSECRSRWLDDLYQQFKVRRCFQFLFFFLFSHNSSKS